MSITFNYLINIENIIFNLNHFVHHRNKNKSSIQKGKNQTKSAHKKKISLRVVKKNRNVESQI